MLLVEVVDGQGPLVVLAEKQKHVEEEAEEAVAVRRRLESWTPHGLL